VVGDVAVIDGRRKGDVRPIAQTLANFDFGISARSLAPN
jgi:hypothetical protein